jgi:hypothetical protein
MGSHIIIDTFGGGGGVETLKNWVIKMQQIKKIEEPFLKFLATPSTPSKEFKSDCGYNVFNCIIGSHIII